MKNLRCLCKFKKKMFFFFLEGEGGVPGGRGGVRFGESGWMEELKFL